MPVPNHYKVPKKQWNKWNQKEVRFLFNNLYGSMITDPAFFQHPKAPAVQKKHWKTIAWNAAWWAAALLHRTYFDKIQED